MPCLVAQVILNHPDGDRPLTRSGDSADVEAKRALVDAINRRVQQRERTAAQIEGVSPDQMSALALISDAPRQQSLPRS